jgi:hypothetical protein
MYTSEMDPKKGPQRLSQHEVALQKAAASATKAHLESKSQPPRYQTPVAGSSDDDDPNGSDTVWSMSRQIYRRNKAKARSNQCEGSPISSSAGLSPITTIPRVESPEPTRQPTPLTGE